MIEEALESPAFYILGFGGSAMVILGWVMSKKMGLGAFPIWQMLILVVGVLVASAYFATRE